MNQPFRLPDPAEAGKGRPRDSRQDADASLAHDTSSREENASGGPGLGFAGAKFARDHNDEINQVARTLAEHGGEAVAFDLALDLVLNEIVEQARSATGASGAAIALTREGEMVCRATAGANAPDLGVRVETESGLAGACLKTGEIQECADTESDPRVNAAAYRQLGVRSMVIAPVNDGQQCFGILEAFSGRANAFGEKDVDALRELARRVALDKKEAAAGELRPAVAPATVVAGNENEPAGEPSAQGEAGVGPEFTPRTAERVSPEEAVGVQTNDVWTTVLVVLVIVVAVALGVMIGWRGAAMARKSASPNAVGNEQASVAANYPTPEGTAEPAVVARATPPQAGNSVSPNSVPANSVPAGGLIVTENGKVIYRIEPANVPPAARRAPEQSSANRIIHWVQPEYPAQATAQGIQGPVVLDVRIGGDGRVERVEVVSGNPLLADAAVSAVKQWVYAPFPGSGKGVERQTRVTIRFTLP